MFSRSLVLAFGLVVFADALHAQLSWKPLDEALQLAQASERLVLLDLRNSAAADPKRNKWIADAEVTPAAVRAMDEMVLARATQSPALDAFPGLAQFRRKSRCLLVLDPWGGVIIEPDDEFADIARFAFELNVLRQQAATFVLSAKQRREGHAARSTATLAGGLLDIGDFKDALELFRKAASMANHDNDQETLQGAQLGIAAIEMQRPEALRLTVYTLTGILEHPASQEIKASAWMLLGHAHREQGESKEAIEAYQHVFELAPKPSPLADAARRHLETLGTEPESEVRADVAAGGVHLIYPHHEVMVGTVDFNVAASADTARVEIFLDDARVAELPRTPFRAAVALGATPRVHTVRAVAWDAKERRLGQETVTLNDRVITLGVSIVTPREDRVTSGTTVEVKPRLPEARRLAGIDLYWNETKVATLTEEPFRYDLKLPSPSAAGYIRVVVRDDSGASAEDAKLLNAAGGSERMGVDAVQVYAIVQDHGRYVDGLASSDFVVKEDGRAVTAQVQSGKADPISIGLALDTSASMQVSMMEVIDYANEFVKDSLGSADQTFVVAFDDQPHLVQPMTSDRGRVTSSIYDMRAGGGTAIWDAILYSLQQFRGVQGKRALIIFTDGKNNSGSATPDGVLQYAREVGVPLYVVQIFTEVRGYAGFHMSDDEKDLRKITGSTGGDFFKSARKVDLPQIFAQIRDDTRGEYLLTYVSPAEKTTGELRKISVEVPARRVTVRATSGYYPR